MNTESTLFSRIENSIKNDGFSDGMIQNYMQNETEPGKGLTFGNPVEDYGTFHASHMSTSELIAGYKGTEFLCGCNR